MPSRIPRAALVFLLAVFAIEGAVHAHRAWFSDLASWQWESKRTAFDAGLLDSDVVIVGSSVLFHGLDPTGPDSTPGGPRVSNLALNGMMLQHQTQVLRRLAARPRPPRLLVLELRHAEVDPASWVRGPYFLSWATFREFAESRYFYWSPALTLEFLGNRLLPSLRYRAALDNWLSVSARLRAPSREILDRNLAVQQELNAHRGFVRAGFDHRSLGARTGAPQPRAWASNAAGELWLRRFLDEASARHLPVVVLLPPAPEPDTAADAAGGFQAGFQATLERLRRDYPSTRLDLFAPTGYTRDDFADPIHLNHRGREKLTAAFATWIADYWAAHHG